MAENKTIRFSNKDKSLFFATLTSRVEQYFKDNNISKHYNSQMVIKTIVLLSGYILPFVYVCIFNPSFGIGILLWAVMGFALAGIGMSVMHDANHEAYTSSKTANKYLGYTLNLLGGSVFNWKLQHNVLHHTYTNVVEYDDDIDDKLIMRFSPHTEVKKYHRFQFIYSFLFYGILSLYWATLKDFVQFARYTKNGVNRNNAKENRITLFKIILSKIGYYFVFMFVPVFFFNVSLAEIVIGFLLMHFIAGVVLTVVFQLAHTVEGTSHPLPNEEGTIENTWAIHQLNTTVNFARHNKFISWYVGGLNFQVEHHLFPRICHVHYPEIAPIVKQTAEEFGIPYLENKSFWEAFRSHVRTLQRFGKLPDINEALA